MEDTSLTKELREYIKQFLSQWGWDKHKLTAIADHIDVEHTRQLDVLYRDMSDAEWIRLPVDVDGAPIHVGDELVDISDTYHRGKARSIELKEDGWIVFVGSLGRWSHAYRHVKTDTCITDELRAVAAKTECANGHCEKLYRGDLDHIADRIDEAHESACKRERGEGIKIAEEAALEEMEQEYIKLPKDANDECIHEHDKVDWRDHAGMWHENVTVVAVCNDGCYVMDGTVFHVHKSDIRHHHVSTIEDVLREFARECLTYATCVDDHEVQDAIETYTTKLQLAGEDE